MMIWDEMFTYNHGRLFWKVAPKRKPFLLGAEAGSRKSGSGYWSVKIDGKNHYRHRIVYEMHNGKIPNGMEIDHKNQIKCDDRIENLEITDNSGNQKNVPLRSDNTSGVVGVCWHKQRGKWVARIESEGKKISLGLYADWFDAVCARKSAELKHGFSKNHGRKR